MMFGIIRGGEKMSAKLKTIMERENVLWDLYGAVPFEEWPEEARAEHDELAEARDKEFFKRHARKKKRKEKRLAAGGEWVD